MPDCFDFRRCSIIYWQNAARPLRQLTMSHSDNAMKGGREEIQKHPGLQPHVSWFLNFHFDFLPL